MDTCIFQITEYIKDKALDRVKEIERSKITNCDRFLHDIRLQRN